MKTLMTSVALLVGAGAFAQTDAKAVPDAPAPFVQSIYDECLMVAGPRSWEALHLDADQVARISDLQARYKASVQAAKEQAAADEKAAGKASGKKPMKEAPTATIAPKAEVAAPVSSATHAADSVVVEPTLGNEATALEPVVEGADVSAANPEGMMDLNYNTVDAELRAILTPSQLAIWERRCDSRTGMQP